MLVCTIFSHGGTLMCQPVLVLPHSTQLRANHKIVLSPPFTFLTCLSISPYRDRNREPRTLPIFDEKRHPLTVSIFKEQFSYSHFRPKDNFQIYLKQILSLHEVLRYMYVHISTWFMEERSMTSYKRPIISS